MKPPFEPDPHAVYAKVGDELASGKNDIYDSHGKKTSDFTRQSLFIFFHFINAI